LSNSHNFGQGDSIVFEYCSSTGITATPLGIYAGKNYYGLYNYVTNVYRYGTDGENNYSITLAGNANTTVTSPLQIPRPLAKWHKANNQTKLYIDFVSNDANLNDRDVWINVSYNSHTSSAVGSFINTLADYGNQTGVASSTYLKSANTNQWTGTGFSTAYRFEVAGIQPQEPGPITVDFYLGKPSTTVWVCPYMEQG
jgi:hypothetical protein